MKVKKGGNVAWKGKIYTAGQELPKDYGKPERVEPPKTQTKTSNKDK